MHAEFLTANPQDLLVEFGHRVRLLRKLRGLSQAQLGQKTGLHQKYIGELECGRKTPSWNTLINLAHGGLEVESWVLLYGLEVHGAQGVVEQFAVQPKNAQAYLRRTIGLVFQSGAVHAANIFMSMLTPGAVSDEEATTEWSDDT